MAQTTTLAQLRTRAFDRMDEGQSQYITPAQMNTYINEAASFLYNFMISQNENYIFSEAIIAPVAGVRDYPLPSDFLRDIRIFAIANRSGMLATAVSDHVPLDRLTANQYRGGNSGDYSYNTRAYPAYMLIGQNVRLDPTPQSTPTYQLLLWYAPSFSQLVNDSDILQVSTIPGHEQWIVNQAVVYAKIKEEQPFGNLQAINDNLLASIRQDISNRDLGAGRRITITDDFNGLPTGGMW